MSKYSLLIAFILFIFTPGISHAERSDFNKIGIDYVWETEPNFYEFKKVYCDAFIKCYENVLSESLGMTSKEEVIKWVDKHADDVYLDFRNSTSKLCLSAKSDNKIVGFLIIDIEKFPEEIYLSELPVDPAYQRQGIGTTLVQTIFHQFPATTKFVVISRKVNEEAKGLYTFLGFTSSPYMHKGYSNDIYSGFEYVNKQNLQGEDAN